MAKKITRKQAEAVLQSVEAQFARYIEPGYGPKLMDEDWDEGFWAIVWEEGAPYEWTLAAEVGGTDEELSVLRGERVDIPAAASWPKGVFAEPVNNCVLGLYPA
jgi:hypothetical protein